jgi:replicative DNA helicase
MMGLELTPEEQVKKAQAKADVEILNDNVFLYDDVYELEKILPEVEINKFDFVVVDFIQNVITQGDKDEYSRLSRVALELQKAAKKYNCMILALSQLSNMVAREGSKGKVLEYKGSGSIATVADLGFFIDRENTEWVPNQDTLLKLELRKNRRGGTGMVFDLYFKVPGGKIYE